MRKCNSTEKKVYIYDIKDTDGTPLEMMNVITLKPSKDGKAVMDSVTTFIGRHDRDEYVSVGKTENLSQPGVIFKYSNYVQEQEMLMHYYLDIYHSHLGNKRYTTNGSYYMQ